MQRILYCPKYKVNIFDFHLKVSSSQNTPTQNKKAFMLQCDNTASDVTKIPYLDSKCSQHQNNIQHILKQMSHLAAPQLHYKTRCMR